ncbi:MAG: MATE family efflux transporter [Armatimonadota bacterium]
MATKALKKDNFVHSPGSIRELLVIALPMMASSVCETVMTFTDRLFLSKLGSAQMNAALCGGLTSFLLKTFFLGLIGYGTALVAQFLGSGKKKNCSVVVTQTAIIAVIAYPIVLLAAPLARAFFSASGIAPEQLVPQTLFFNILIYASIIGLLQQVFGCFFSGIGRTRIVMIASVVAMTVNVGVNYVLVLGHFGVHSLGIRGSAYGTITGGICSLLILAAAYFFGGTHKEYGVKDSFKLDFDVMRKLLKFGYPAGLEFFLNLAAFNGMVMLFDAQGQLVATAATVTFNWDMVAFIPLVGIEIAVTSLVGRYMGARQPDTAHVSAMSGIKVGSIYSIAMLIMFLAVPNTLVNIFRPEVNDTIFTQAMPLTLFMVRLVAVYVLSEAVMVAFTGALRGAGDTFWAMSISVTLHWLMVGVLFVMFKKMHTSAELAWVALVTWMLLFTFVFYLRYRSGKWREIKLIHDPGTDMVPVHEGFHEQADL